MHRSIWANNGGPPHSPSTGRNRQPLRALIGARSNNPQNKDPNFNPGPMAVCGFFQRGTCKFGNNCRNEHPGQQTNYVNANNNRFGAFAGGDRYRPVQQSSGFRGGAANNRDNGPPFHLSKDVIKDDLTVERPIYPLSCYGPGRDAPCQLIEGPIEISPEELRLRYYSQRAQGNETAAQQEESAMGRQMQQQVDRILNDLDGAIKYVEDGINKHPNRVDIAGGKLSAGGANSSSSTNSFSSPAASFGGNQASSSSFAQPRIASAFGQPSNPGQTVSAFGQQSNPGQSASAFGKPSGLGQTTSAFGQPQATSAFGQRSALGQGSSAFGQTSNPGQTTAPFGRTNPLGGQGASPFGQPGNPGQRASPFGQPSNPGQNSSPFGQPSNVGQTTSAFGKPSGVGQSSSAFGQPSNPGQTSSAFGQPSNGGQTSSAFGQNSKPAQSQSPFGQVPSPFAQPPQPAPTAAAFAQPAQPAQTSSAFGQPAKPAQSTPAFGQQARVSGDSGTNRPAFGQTMFGQASQPAAANPFSQQPQGQQQAAAGQQTQSAPDLARPPPARTRTKPIDEKDRFKEGKPEEYEGERGKYLEEVYTRVGREGWFRPGEAIPTTPPKCEWIVWEDDML